MIRRLFILEEQGVLTCPIRRIRRWGRHEIRHPEFLQGTRYRDGPGKGGSPYTGSPIPDPFIKPYSIS